MRTKILTTDICALISCVVYAGLAFISHHNHPNNLSTFLSSMSMVWILLFLAFRSQRQYALSLKRVLCWAILLRMIGMFSLPLFENDYFRYLWDGYQFATIGNPYAHAPAAFSQLMTLPTQWQMILHNINYSHISTIYGPVCQLFFLLSYLISPGDLWPFKLLLCLLDLLAIVLMSKISPTKYLILYAWCPLLVFEISFNAHVEMIGVFFVILALYFLKQERRMLTAISLAIASGARIFALLITPFILRKFRPVFWLGFLGVLLILYLPFWWQGKADTTALRIFLVHWEFNSSIFALFQWLLGTPTAKMLVVVLYIGFFIYYWYHCRLEKSADIPRGDIIFGLFFLLSPVFNSWYALWLLPFATLYPSRWVWTTMVVVVLSYITGQNLPHSTLPAFNHPDWVRPIEFIPILIMLIWDALETIHYKKRESQLK